MREQHATTAGGALQKEPATIPRRVHGNGDWDCSKEEGSKRTRRDGEGRPVHALTEQQAAHYAIATSQIDLQNKGNVKSTNQAQRQAPHAQSEARIGIGEETGKQTEGCSGGSSCGGGPSSGQRRRGCYAPGRPSWPDQDRGRSDRVSLWRRPRPDGRACTPARGKFPVADVLYDDHDEDAFMYGGLYYQGLCRLVPMQPPKSPSANQSRHGPSGGHVRGADKRRPRDGPQEDRPGTFDNFDILDYCETVYSVLQYWWQKHAMSLQRCSCGLLLTLVSISILELWWLLFYASPKPRKLRGHRGMRPARHNVWRAVVVLAVLPSVYAGPPKRPFYKAPPPPRPTDLELWAAGQMTLPEQMAAAMQRFVLEHPVQHNQGIAEPPNLTVVPPDLVGEPVVPTMEERAIHVTLWVAAVHYESETLDLQLPAPLTLVGMKEALRGACNIVPDALDEFHPTVPQLGDYYGSFVAQPVWLRNTNRTTLIIDARSLGGTAFPYYQEGRVNLQTVSRQLPEFHQEEIDFYVFGRLTPLVRGQNIVAVPGGVIKAVPHGRQCFWSDLLEDRLLHPLRWSPQVEPPSQVPGLHSVFQTSTEQIIDEIEEDDTRPLEVVAEEALGLEHGETTVFLPNDRMAHLSHAGRSIFEQVAVVPSGEVDPAGPCIVFVDLRPLTLFPQWLQMASDVFDPRAYIRDFQIQGSEDWVIVVEGGEPQRGGRLRVRHQETLTFTLQPPGTSSDESDSDGDDDDGDGSEGPAESSSDLSILHSSDMSDCPPSPTGAPRGPPPPQPMDRSRSPRRGHAPDPATATSPDESGVQIKLADKLPVPVFDMDQESVRLPHSPSDLQSIGRVWPPEWMQLDFSGFCLKKATISAMAELVPWTSLLVAMHGANALVAHLYTDGSFDAQNATSGAAMLVLLEQQGQLAIMGGCGSPILGDEASPWQDMLPPALYAEQVALTIALLWVWQAMSILPLQAAVIHFDCQAAGWGADGTWSQCNQFANKTRELARAVHSLLDGHLSFEYVQAHNGNAWNECADVLAKAAARQDDRLPRPPKDNCEALLRADLGWVATSWCSGAPGALPIQQGQWLQWNASQQTEGNDLTPSDLVPTAATLRSKDHAVFHSSAVSVNIQGLKGKHAYLESQLAWKRIQLVFIQETKDTILSKRFLRLASKAESHWGTAIWFSREHGAFDIGGEPVIVDEADVTTVASEPRLLLVMVQKVAMRILLFSGHIPHAAREAEREHFLVDLRRRLQALPTVDIIIGGLDANARPPLSFAQVTGTRACGEADMAGQALATFLHEQGLWLPSTFDEHHEGSDVTYQHPCGQEHRIDFFAVGGEAEALQVTTKVAHDLDTANKLEDHKAIALELTMQTAGGQVAKRLYRPRFDRHKLRTAEGKAIIQRAMQDYRSPDWTANVDRHCQHLQEHILKVLEANFKIVQGGPRATYISDAVWEWRRAKLRLKQAAGHRRKMWSDAVGAAFRWWSGRDSHWNPAAVNKHGILYQVVAAAVSLATDRIKKQVYVDKASFLRKCAYDGASNVGQILHKLKQNGVGGKKNKTARRPLPCLEMPDGTMAGSREQRDEVWLRHFGAQEYGTILPTKDFLVQACRQQGVQDDMTWDIGDIPTVLEVEQALREVPLGKAAGLDNLPGEVLRAAPAAMAAAAHPLFAKALLNLRQPVQWRGGILFEAWQGAGSMADPASHRSLFVSSALGKAYHKLMRNRGQGALQTILHDLHLGSRGERRSALPRCTF